MIHRRIRQLVKLSVLFVLPLLTCGASPALQDLLQRVARRDDFADSAALCATNRQFSRPRRAGILPPVLLGGFRYHDDHRVSVGLVSGRNREFAAATAARPMDHEQSFGCDEV